MGIEVAVGAAIVGSITTGVMAYKSYKEQKKAANIQREQAKQQEAVNEAQASQQRQSAARERRLKRARILQRAQAMGITGSSAVGQGQNALASGQDTMGSQQGFATAVAAGRSETNQALANTQSNINRFNTIGKLGGLATQMGMSYAKGKVSQG
ncbi:hypothetical protein [Salinivibrio phage CW02]|uniref:Internal virion protein n=1 Tax=Salinivibrio phage CW02 TaxID=1161935 RepID=H9D1G5_9CAUD|nr:hypothetical protein F490_gp30 [Salinivibrio phage CW02]AFE86207.1 hypothetical protein [Salinivibrio phage CW02]